MSSLSTLPKGDSAWLLRKSIQRIMQQVSVLETNIGSSTTGNSSNGQVIFNDNGTLRGDADMTFNTALNRLIVSSLEVSTTATITGALTVQGVGGISIGSASFTSGRALAATSPAGSAVGIRLLQSATSDWEITNVATAGNLSITQSGANLLSLTGAGVFTFGDGAGGTRMTLNSAGLGIGASPTEKLTINNSPGAVTGGIRVYANDQSIARIAVQNTNGQAWHLVAGNPGANNQGFAIYDYTNSATRMYFDTSGNVGIGVTPSSWVAGAKALQFGAYGALAQSSSGNVELSFNSYNSGAGAYKYLQTDTASLYRASSIHSWFVAPSGNAGDLISFGDAKMTLDASGRLILLASTTTPATLATNGELTFTATSNTNLRFSYRGSDGTTRTADITLA